MSKEKQIEEMHLEFEKWDDAETEFSLSEWLYNAGYRKQSGWISVDERLPMRGELVLVSSMDKITKKHGWFYLASYDKERKWWNGASFGRVTHWMPLPEPPKGD
jgi:hypothetical protein